MEKSKIFSDWEIKAILADRKTRFSEPLRPQPAVSGPGWIADQYNGGPEWAIWQGCKMSEPRTWLPKYPLGTKVWGREAWARCDDLDITYYRATDAVCGRWRSASQMRRWASRITLRITDVKAQMLGDVTPEEAMAEGAPMVAGVKNVIPVYEQLWNDRWAKRGYPWDPNMWVFAYEFEVVK